MRPSSARGPLGRVRRSSHFTGARLSTFDHYPDDVALGYDTEDYKRLIVLHRVRGERDFSHSSADSPRRGAGQEPARTQEQSHFVTG